MSNSKTIDNVKSQIKPLLPLLYHLPTDLPFELVDEISTWDTIIKSPYDGAEKEAIRLAKLLNKEAFIVGVVASVKPIVSHEVINRTKKTYV